MFSVKNITPEMFSNFQDCLTQFPYAASFFSSYVNQEFIDDKVPDLVPLRGSLVNIKPFDFQMIHEECMCFHTLTLEIVNRFSHVYSYKLLLNKFNDMIDEYQQNLHQLTEILDQLSKAVMSEQIDEIRVLMDKLQVEKVTQVNLRVKLLDRNYLNSNPLSVALCHEKYKVVEYLLDSNMIDINYAFKRAVTTLNEN